MEATLKAPAKAILQAVEVTAVVDEKHNLQLDAPLPGSITGRVRVIVLAPEIEYDHSDLTEEQWLRAASVLQAQDFEDDPADDIYILKDGKPIREQA